MATLRLETTPRCYNKQACNLLLILNMQALILLFLNFCVLDFATLCVPVTIMFTKSIKCYVTMVCHTVNCIVNKADHIPTSEKTPPPRTSVIKRK